MLVTRSPRLIPSRASLVATPIQFRGGARALLRDELSTPEFFDILVNNEEWTDAIRFLAHALPKRAAIWWGSLCVWHVYQPAPTEPVRRVLEAAAAWVRQPDECNRRLAEAALRVAGTGTPAGCLGMAVFWSGGSITPVGLPAVEPPPFVTARAVAGAVLLAAAGAGESAQRIQCRREFLAVGRDVARGRNRWYDTATPESGVGPQMSGTAAEMVEACA